MPVRLPELPSHDLQHGLSLHRPVVTVLLDGREQYRQQVFGFVEQGHGLALLIRARVGDLTETDVIVLAGDVGVGTGGLDWLSRQRRRRPVIYAPGNHELYGHDLSLVDELRSRAPRDVHVLDNQASSRRSLPAECLTIVNQAPGAARFCKLAGCDPAKKTPKT